MYHEEKVINGILCYRTDPKQTFKQYNAGQLTEKYLTLKKETELFTAHANDMIDRIQKTMEEIHRPQGH